MQNQDPTADTDPNEYINQLVQVNSLEQLIDINQTLTTDSTSTGATPSSKVAGATAGVSSGANTAATQSASAAKHDTSAAAVSPSSQTAKSPAAAAQARYEPGNLAIPTANPSAHRVARALDGHSRAKTVSGRLPGAL
jgi:flagellar basal-body rod modification protein FlgD